MRTALHDLLREASNRTPDATALTCRDESLTYQQAWDRTQAVAAQLQGLGLAPFDRVAVFLEKRIETVVALVAASAAGGMLVPVNPVLKPGQVEHILRDSGARFLVTSADRARGLSEVVPQAVQVILVNELAEAGEHPAVPWRVDTDPAAILYTSGSTGKPKGVVLSHRNLIVGAESVSGYLGNTEHDVILSVLPLSFDAGLSQVTTAMAVGAQCVLLNYLTARDVVRACQRHGVTGLTCVPPLWIQLAAVDWPQDVGRRLRYFANTGGRMPRATLDRLRTIFPEADPYLMYGLTEAFRSTYLDPAEVDRRPDSIGKAIDDAEVLVLRPDGSRCAPGEPGELVHRGPLVALGYWNDAERSSQRFRPFPHAGQEWRQIEMAVWSGDTVVADDDGFLYFVGREDEMIKTSGYRVSPTEIEEAAYATGLVRDAVAVGIPDDVLGQAIVLFVAAVGARLDAPTLLHALTGILPRYMLPGTIEMRTELPRSPNGKFDRVLLGKEARGEV